jgi:hypothetical protein
MGSKKSRETTIHVNDLMQKATYVLTEPTGKNFDERFHPELTPKEIFY